MLKRKEKPTGKHLPADCNAELEAVKVDKSFEQKHSDSLEHMPKHVRARGASIEKDVKGLHFIDRMSIDRLSLSFTNLDVLNDLTFETDDNADLNMKDGDQCIAVQANCHGCDIAETSEVRLEMINEVDSTVGATFSKKKLLVSPISEQPDPNLEERKNHERPQLQLPSSMLNHSIEPKYLLKSIPNVSRNFEECYELHEVLGHGKYSFVHRSVHRNSKRWVAVKVIEKCRVLESRFLLRELEIMHLAKHKNIVDLIEVFENANRIYLVLELCASELFAHIDENGPLVESDSKKLVCSLLKAVFYWHENDIVHRDIKPENILLALHGTISDIKLSDFGVSRKLHGPIINSPMKTDQFINSNATEPSRQRLSRAHTKCGSREYVAPEVMKGNGYGTQVDMWSIGVVTHVTLTGCLPVYKINSDGSQKVHFGSSFDSISENAKVFISQLLLHDPVARMNATTALRHEWFIS